MVVVNASDPIPAVVESDATGDIKNIFDDIKNVTGVNVVNLVWRHLATTQKRTAVSLGSFTSFIRKRLYQSSSVRISKPVSPSKASKI